MLLARSPAGTSLAFPDLFATPPSPGTVLGVFAGAAPLLRALAQLGVAVDEPWTAERGIEFDVLDPQVLARVAAW